MATYLKNFPFFVILCLLLSSGLWAQQTAIGNKTGKVKAGDLVWVNGKWQRIKKVSKYQVHYFVKRTYYAKIDEQVWHETQTQPRLFRHLKTGDTLSLYYDSETGIDNYLLPLAQRHYDNEPLAPRTWRYIDFVMTDGKDTTAVFWLGRPVWWMEYHKADKIGNKVWLEMPEQGIGGYATVTAIKACPHDTRAWKRSKTKHSYRPVIGKFQRWSSNVWNYTFDTGETLGATPEHPFYSLERKAYIAIGDIKLQERIRTYGGKPARLIAKKKRVGREKVYNLEIHKDHNFFVGKSGLSVHNSYIAGVPKDKQQKFLKHKDKFEVQGDNVVIKDDEIRKKINSLEDKKDEFIKDLIEGDYLVDEVVKSPVKRIDNWVRDYETFKKFIGQTGEKELKSMKTSFLNQKPLWLTREGFQMIMKTGLYDAAQEQAFKLVKRYDIALGLDKFTSVFKKNLVDWAKSKKLTSFHNFEPRGFISKDVVKNIDLTQYEILQGIIRCRSKNGTNHFRMDGVAESIKKSGSSIFDEISKNPNAYHRDVGFIGWTMFELRNIVRNKDWFENTTFYLGRKKLTKQELLDDYGIRYLGN